MNLSHLIKSSVKVMPKNQNKSAQVKMNKRIIGIKISKEKMKIWFRSDHKLKLMRRRNNISNRLQTHKQTISKILIVLHWDKN